MNLLRIFFRFWSCFRFRGEAQFRTSICEINGTVYSQLQVLNKHGWSTLSVLQLPTYRRDPALLYSAEIFQPRWSSDWFQKVAGKK